MKCICDDKYDAIIIIINYRQVGYLLLIVAILQKLRCE